MPRSRRPQAWLMALWAAMLLTSLALAALGRLALPAGFAPPEGPTPARATVVAALGVLGAAVVLLLDRLLLAPARVARRLLAPDRGLALRYLVAGHLALWSLAQLPAIFGFAQVLLGGSLRTHLALCGLSLGLLALLLPTETRIGGRLDAVLQSCGPTRRTGSPGLTRRRTS